MEVRLSAKQEAVRLYDCADIWTLKGRGRTTHASWLTPHLSRLTALTSVVIGKLLHCN